MLVITKAFLQIVFLFSFTELGRFCLAWGGNTLLLSNFMLPRMSFWCFFRFVRADLHLLMTLLLGFALLGSLSFARVTCLAVYLASRLFVQLGHWLIVSWH